MLRGQVWPEVRFRCTWLVAMKRMPDG